jgi:hypothetical protein
VFFAGFLTWKEAEDRYRSVVFLHNVPTQRISGGDTYLIERDDYLLVVASSPTKPTTLKLPPDPYRGQRFEIKDENGAVSASAPIVIDGMGHQIDAGNTIEMQTPYRAITVTYSGIKWVLT